MKNRHKVGEISAKQKPVNQKPKPISFKKMVDQTGLVNQMTTLVLTYMKFEIHKS